MKLTLRNLGRLREATIDLDKDLILLTGPNNTSKTYVAHAIYGFHARLTSYAAFAVDHAFEGFFSKGADVAEPVKINVLDFVDKRLPSFLESIERGFHNDLADILASSKAFVAQTEVGVGVDPSEVSRARQHLLALQSKSAFPDVGVLENKAAGEPIWSFDAVPGPVSVNLSAAAAAVREQRAVRRRAWIRFSAVVARALNFSFFPHVLTAERAAIQLFSRELAIKRTELVDDLLTLEGGKPSGGDASQAFAQTLSRRASRYPLAIRDSLRTANDLAAFRKVESPLAPLARHMENGLLHGAIQIDDDGEVSFRPEGSDAQLGLPLASSSVKSLAGLSFFLRHVAGSQLLIIDEPEQNLHPDNQRKVARVLARIARSGVKVLMSTHSDYVIRELNNLIMLNEDKGGSVRARYGYESDETLSPSQVGAYLFNSERANPIEVKPTGIEVETIDREINSLNTVSQSIYFALFGEADV